MRGYLMLTTFAQPELRQHAANGCVLALQQEKRGDDADVKPQASISVTIVELQT